MRVAKLGVANHFSIGKFLELPFDGAAVGGAVGAYPVSNSAGC
jgi:hypothetical protein